MDHCRPTQAISRKHLFDAFWGSIAGDKVADEIAVKLGKLAQPGRIRRGGTAAIDPDDGAFVYIGNGATKLIARGPGGREQIVAFHFPGDLVSIPAGTKNSSSLCALVDTEILSFPADKFLGIVRSEPVFLNTLLHRSLTALERCREKIILLGRKNAQERLASFLTGMAERIGSTQAGECTLELPMSHKDIGDSLGLTIETISRQFGNLRSAGLVRTTGRSRVVLCDIAALADRAVDL